MNYFKLEKNNRFIHSYLFPFHNPFRRLFLITSSQLLVTGWQGHMSHVTWPFCHRMFMSLHRRFYCLMKGLWNGCTHKGMNILYDILIYYMIYSSLDKFIIVETTTLHLSIWPKGINLFTLGISTSSRVSAVHSIDH